MHDGGIVFSGEDITSATHVSGKLIHVVDSGYHAGCYLLVAQITLNKFMCCGL
jgi:hypothetical protein